MGKVSKNIKSKFAEVLRVPLKQAVLMRGKKMLASTSTVAGDRSQLLKTKTINKREKISRKRKSLMNKIYLMKKQQKEDRARKNRENAAITGDLKPLKDALPSLDEILKLSEKADRLKTNPKEFHVDGAPQTQKLTLNNKIKLKKENFFRKVNSYENLLKDPDFKRNPRGAIRYHIQYTHNLIEE